MNHSDHNKVLIVDDSKTLLSVLSDFLAFKGFDVTTAESAEQALEKMDARKPDIIVLDIGMPGMGGLGFLKRIMSADGKLQYPVLVFTARAIAKDYFQGIAVDGFIAKPCDKNELVSKISEILTAHSSPFAGGKTGSKTILIGEDNTRVADSLVEEFRRGGYRVERVATGPEILERAATEMPHAILLKQILPKLHGSSVASVLQAMPRTHTIPVVVYDASGISTEADGERYLRPTTGIRRFLLTNQPARLMNAIEEVLRESWAPSAEQTPSPPRVMQTPWAAE